MSDSLDESLVLMHFAFRGLIREADDFLDKHGLSRVHHRILFAVARSPGVNVGSLQTLLGVSKQALHRPLKQLLELGYVVSQRSSLEHRSKELTLSAAGRAFEKKATSHEQRAMKNALTKASAEGVQAWRAIMLALARESQR
ncbi:MarR family winged helix-turn-helix transcriptional regulator [Rhodoferax sp.]|uniref:MarR family winged helix-turn-helix transcriptional regulator n=1 Tax=Rhodoferax sp. TaxID=50421 RepID=UPI0027562368|nr:MarR family transcriptional regulator [Rhodoferax sp.]